MELFNFVQALTVAHDVTSGLPVPKHKEQENPFILQTPKTQKIFKTKNNLTHLRD